MFLAKSESMESIKEHTDMLLYNLKILKGLYGEQITRNVNIKEKRFWYLMEIICKYHDVGKVFTAFQNIVRSKINLELLPTRFNYEIKHEQISPAFVPKGDLTESERILIYQSIYYHHERDIINIDRKLLKEIIEEDIKPNLVEIERELEIEIGDLKTFYLGLVEGTKRICEGDDLYNDYCIMKGLLHRLDHCSSAGIKIEDDTNNVISESAENYISYKFNKLNELQIFSKENKDNNVVVIGSTGIGKTESALLWSDFDKTFFTLPLRISINAIYDRILNDIKYENIGLLHSTALDYLEEKDNDESNEFYKLVQSQNMYSKVTTCTIDQIFPFVFKYRGYEKIYATLSYSKVIIDEIQAYSPEIVAIILKGLQMIYKLGGKFMVMTATLPRIYKDELEKMKIPFVYNMFVKQVKRHKIKLEDKQIDEDVERMIQRAENGKVLIIVNTINKAIELYMKLKSKSYENINLLHSRFILQDRNEKENKIKEFSKHPNEKGIWITTQIVEASLDIDFDYLFTEMSTLDSLFQRLGRCYRSREYKNIEPNCYIYVKNASGVKYIYDKYIHEKSIELLEKYDNSILEEDVKIELVDKLYSKDMINESDFYKNFKSGMYVLNNLIDYGTSKKEAGKLLRKIDNINVIPNSIYEENLDLFISYENESNKKEKNKIRRNIGRLLTSINKSNMYKLSDYIIECPYCKNDIYIINSKYDREIGLLLTKDEEYEIDSRML